MPYDQNSKPLLYDNFSLKVCTRYVVRVRQCYCCADCVVFCDWACWFVHHWCWCQFIVFTFSWLVVAAVGLLLCYCCCCCWCSWIFVHVPYPISTRHLTTKVPPKERCIKSRSDRLSVFSSVIRGGCNLDVYTINTIVTYRILYTTGSMYVIRSRMLPRPRLPLRLSYCHPCPEYIYILYFPGINIYIRGYVRV